MVIARCHTKSQKLLCVFALRWLLALMKKRKNWFIFFNKNKSMLPRKWIINSNQLKWKLNHLLFKIRPINHKNIGWNFSLFHAPTSPCAWKTLKCSAQIWNQLMWFLFHKTNQKQSISTQIFTHFHFKFSDFSTSFLR